VLFADVSNFTSLSERLDPEEVHGLVREALVPISEEIHRYEGTIVQFLGDGVMALFGAPIAHEDAPQRGLHAALGIRERIREYAARLKPKGIGFEMHIGLNSGLVVVGKIGDDLTMEYTAMGDTVNLASRLGSLAQPGTILVSENTYRLTEGYFDFKALGEIEVKGKKQPVKPYELLSPGRAKTRLEVAAARGLTPFVARKKELDHLRDCFDGVKSGQGRVVGMVGEPGVGKSRLLLQMREMVLGQDCTYLEGDCLHYGEAMPYLPFLDILRSYFNINEGDREYLTKKSMAEKIDQLDPKLKGVLPPLHDILSLKVEDEAYLKLDPPQKRMRIFEGLRDLLVRESQKRPLVCAAEDLHWIDKSSEELLGYLMGFMANARIMLILLYRPEYVNPWTSRTYYSQIGVDQLPLSTSAEMVQAMLHEGKATPDLQELILSRAAGNPLFMEELTRSLFDQGFIQRQNGHYILIVKPADIQVPDTVQGIIAARMDRLEESLKQTMQVASVIGREFGLRLLQAVTGRGEEVKSHLADLQGLELVYQKSLFPEPEYIFKHALTQDVAYNSLLHRRRQELHQRIGDAAEAIYADRLEESYETLAYHYSKAENAEKAYQYLKLSGDKAARRYSSREAFRFYREAIRVLDGMPQTDDNKRRGIEVRIAANLPMLALAYPEDSLQVLREGERLARELADERGLAQIFCLLGCCSFFRGDPREAIKYSETSFEMAERMRDVETIAASAFDLGQSYFVTGEIFRIAEVLPRVISLLESTERQSESFGRGFNIYSQLLGQYGQALGMTGSYQEGVALCEKAVRYAEDLNDPYSLAFIELGHGQILLLRGDAKRALAHFLKAREHAEQGQITFMLGYIWNSLGWSYYMLRELPTALEQMEKGLRLQIEANNPVALSMSYHGLGMVLCDLGDLTRARENLEKALKLAVKNNEKMYEGMTRSTLGKVIGKLDASRCAEAESMILEGVSILYGLKLRPLLFQAYTDLAELYRCTGQRAKEQMALAQAFAIPR
jgi:predicted ATPase/class 3 adenylate cyclase